MILKAYVSRYTLYYMENHPIPQDVTGFKFRLIGSVTVKQFLYLLGGGVFALLFYFFPIPFLLKLPFMLLSGGIGLSLAFIPIDGRPMDKMIYNFIKAIPAENQYIYKKHGVDMPYFSFIPASHAQVTVSSQDSAAVQKAKLFNQLSKSYFQPDAEDQEKVASISNLFQQGAPPAQGFTNRVINADEFVKTVSPATSGVKVISTETEAAKPHVSVPPVENVTPPPASPQVVAAPVLPPAETDAVVAPAPATPHGIDMPNILQGTIKDPRGKVVPHVIVEVLDANNTPLRTFRTDVNGFFRAGTPLPNGTYTIHLEDTLKKQEFEDVKVTLTGAISEPIQISSVDQREKLRRELFGVAHNTPQ